MSYVLITAAVLAGLVATGFLGVYVARRSQIAAADVSQTLPPLADGAPLPEHTRIRYLLRRLSEHLGAGEEIEAWVYGTYDGDTMQRRGILALTSERVVAYAPTLFGHEMETIPLRRIAAVQSRAGAVGQAIEIVRSGGSVEVDHLEASDIDRFEQRLRARLN